MIRSATKQKIRRYERGFSLVELLVSLSVFSIVMTISIGTILIMIDINAKAQALFTSTTNVSFALDNITREIRTGYRYYCSDTISDNNPYVRIEEETVHECDSGQFIYLTRGRDGVRTGYDLYEDENGVGSLRQWSPDHDNWIQLTSPADIDIEVFDLMVSGVETAEDGDESQPAVHIHIRGKLNNGLDVATDFELETNVVQRRLDIL